jgi:hypothetical protein
VSPLVYLAGPVGDLGGLGEVLRTPYGTTHPTPLRGSQMRTSSWFHTSISAAIVGTLLAISSGVALASVADRGALASCNVACSQGSCGANAGLKFWEDCICSCSASGLPLCNCD